MTKHRQPSSSTEPVEMTGSSGDGALGAPRRRIAMTMLGSTVAACAVFGAVAGGTGSIGLAANPAAVPAAEPKPKPAPLPPQLDARTVQMLAGAGPALVKLAPTPVATATPAPPTQAPAPKPKSKPVPSKAPTAKKPVSQSPVKSNPYAGESAYAVAQGIVPGSQFGCFDWIVTRESGWNVEARNPSSGAYGLGQALPGSKMASAGSDWETNPATQVEWTLGYMDSRYGSPCAAQSFWESHGWY